MDNFPDFPQLSDEEEDIPALLFDFEDVEVPLPDMPSLEAWIHAVAASHGCTVHQVQYVFCSDDYLHQMNVDYLQHDTLTDIITFPYANPPAIEGEIYVSVDRVKDNATDLNLPFQQELLRVIIHGILHLCGTGDKTEGQAAVMRAQEDAALQLWANEFEQE